ncbi:hypothetical protein [Amniculibacterium sp. G2-70]|uniref:hypothetical protein n=1 Tax=Amniculibacterium sp. G2-70 TaxID=2767188 RepID=UPI0016548DAE|nr:hypothetical protein [Amniculibacterium sp. G2-70]
MKKLILIFFNLLYVLCLLSCANFTSKKQDQFFVSQFFNNEVVFDNLAKYYPRDNTIKIYDRKKELVDKSITYGSSSKKIKIDIYANENQQDYFVIYNFILNQDLATIVFATSDMEYGIIFHLQKIKIKNDMQWVVVNTIHKYSR